MSRRPGLLAVAAPAALAAVLLIGLPACSPGDGSSTSRPPATVATSEAVTLPDLATDQLVVGRAPFCDQLDAGAAAAALGEQPAQVEAYTSGQRVQVSDDVADVVHEFGCRWTAGSGTAQAWVFAPPVTVARAERLVAEVADGARCRTGPAAGFGQPSAACTSRSHKQPSTSFYGLFGDAWLSCRLTLPDESATTVADRAAAWCAAVALGASSRASAGD